MGKETLNFQNRFLTLNRCLNLLDLQNRFPPDQLPPHLQVSVHNAHVMQVFHSVQDLLDELTGIFLSVKSFFHNPVEEFATGHSANGKTERCLQSRLSHTHQHTRSLLSRFFTRDRLEHSRIPAEPHADAVPHHNHQMKLFYSFYVERLSSHSLSLSYTFTCSVSLW